ncbi:hypothetical protein KI655_18650 [Vibrio sp. D404a]|uniref:hypothetical protein n=1 Tax=unclassified Vibrio TaxID=2614977 RepID=UPI00255401DE|nr:MULTISPECIES: hypothetical protein [unclassified Vibrio]MDK9739319.1 hypothetical protein [Vibrio sp. D404a]MDK9797646.1 hypothetical protein [Vibrio sp. D449a]
MFNSNSYIFEKTPNSGTYVATVPTPFKNDYDTKTFHGPTAKQDAKEWRDRTAIEYWGVRRWMFFISGAINVRTLRSNTNGVFVSEAESHSKPNNNGEIFGYPYVRVEWREEKVGLCKTFFYSRYEKPEEAEIEASLYAARLKASLTGGELNLPFTRESFDLDAVNTVATPNHNVHTTSVSHS